MPYQITFIPETKIIKTVFDGNVKKGEVDEVMVKNLEMAKEYQTALFLVDCTEIKDESSFVLENYETGILLTKIAKEMPGRLKDALILPRSPKAAENLRFFETVTRNRGMSVRSFENEADAIAWLLS